MREVSTLATLGAVLCFCASSAQGVGFGRVSNLTQLGQPLNFSAVIRLSPDEILSRECVSAEVQSGENMLQPGLVRATLEGSPDSADRLVVRVTTNALIDEPVVTVSVTVGCDAKVTRKFVTFVDPPVINLAQAPSAIAPEAPAVQQRNDSPVAAVVDSARSLARPAPPPKRSATVAARSRPRARVITATRAVPARSIDAVAPPRAANVDRAGGAPRQPAVARADAPGSKLVIDSAPRMPALGASAPASGPLIAAAAASAASAALTPPQPAIDDQAAQLARERERVRLLEEGLAKLRSDSQATQSSLVALQAKLKQAEAQRDAGWLVYALAALSGLLALIAAALAWRQWRARRLAAWWNPATATATGAPSAPPPPIVRAEPVVPEPVMPRLASTRLLVARGDHTPTVINDAVRTQAVASAAVVDEPPRELSVEELIDLEQQAEFFLVLGQDDAAIELLMSHVRSDGGISPLPYLKLLEIYRRQGDTAAYQRIRERFNLRFNAYAPDWDADLQHGRALADYPDTVKHLQHSWPQPSQVMELLDASLFRRKSSDETFDLPAYRELLFLYSVARDLAEHEGGADFTGHVDLLLPMHDDTAPMPAPLPVTRLSAVAATPQFANSAVMTLPVDLDVSFEPMRSTAVSAEMPVVAFAPVTPYEPAGSAEFGFLEFNLDDVPALPKTGSTGKA